MNIRALLPHMRWWVSLGMKFFRVVPLHTASIVIATLISQISVLLAFLLPLKVVILLSSSGIPGYFPNILSGLSRDALVLALAVAAVAFFVLHLCAERVIHYITEYGAKRLLERSSKMVLFEGQNGMATKTYERYSRALASASFVMLAFSALGFWVYEDLFFLLLLYSLVFTVLLCVLLQVSEKFRNRLEGDLSGIANLVGVGGFFVAFLYMIADFIFGSTPGLTYAIISIILVRQITSRSVSFVLEFSGLRKQSVKINALFFHGHALVSNDGGAGQTIWSLIKPDRRDGWVRSLLGKWVCDPARVTGFVWHHMAMSNVVAFSFFDADTRCRYLIKLFEKNRSAMGQHEASLLVEESVKLPSPQFVTATYIDRFPCHVYRLPGGRIPVEAARNIAIERIRSDLLAVEPPEPLVQRYIRSRPLFTQRLNVDRLEWIGLAADTAEGRNLVNYFLSRLPFIRESIAVLPLCFVNPDINTAGLWVAEDGYFQPMILNWAQWALEPLGAGWPEQPEPLASLAPALSKAKIVRPSLISVEPEQVELAALMYTFEKAYSSQAFPQALGLLPAIIDRFEMLRR